MTLQEAIQAAENGSTEAMYALGSYYLDQKQPSDAADWLYRAVQAGHLPSATLLNVWSKVLAEASEKIEDWEGAFEYWKQYRECQPLIMQVPDSTDADCIKALQEMKRALFGQGLACCHLEHFELATQFLTEAAKDDTYVNGDERAKKLLRQLGGLST